MRQLITYFTLTLSIILHGQIDYETQIQPIFDANCVSCHSNGAAYTGGLELINYDALMAGGYNTDNTNVLSVLEDYITTGYMPAWGADPLLEEEIELINQWIYEGGNPSNNGGSEDCPCINPDWINPMAICTMESNPVIGCDDIVYGNPCLAEAAGVTSYTDGAGIETILVWDCETEGEGCYDADGEYYNIGSEWFFSDCLYSECLGGGIWSDIIEIENCGGCMLSDGTTVSNGWSGNGVGNNWCNSCFCESGILSCTEMDCGGNCESDIDQDGICEDDCGEDYPMIIVDCACSWINPYTYTVYYYDFDEENCELTENCYCECINDINNNGICDEEETECIAELDPFCSWITVWDPVCGCDGVTYSNSGEAACNNIFQYTEGECNNSGCSEIPISCDGGSWQAEVSWNIVDSNGNVVAEGGAPYSETICLEDDCFTINMEDSYGDGWNGNTLLVGGLSFGDSFTTGYSATGEFCTPLIIIYGCTSSYAINYDPDANVDDGSCEIDPNNCEYLLSYDSYVDFNYDNSISNYYCNYYVSNGTYTIQQAESYGYNCDCVILGCTDETATNYNETAFVDDCSCVYENDCPSISFNTTDSSLGWQIENSDGEIVLEYNNTGGQEIGGYCANYCFEDGCYTVTMNSMWGGGWYQTTLNIGEYEYTFSTGYSSVAPFGYNSEDCMIEGCTSGFADNYNPDANYDDGSCEYSCEYLLTYDSYVELGYDYTVSNYLCYDYVSYYNYTVEYIEDMFGYNCDCVITGCTDEEATNYDAEAFIDDCSCVYENDCPSISFNTTDSSLGWRIDNMNGETILEYNTSGTEIGSYCGNYCFEDGCYIITMTSTWGGGWYQTMLEIGDDSFTLPTGYEGIAAFAYNTDMNCEIGCTDPEASNYNPEAILDDGSCVVFGCTITTACNYNPEATAFDGSCYYCYMDDCNMYPSDFYDCDGNCFDNDQDGICDWDEVIGCMDETACNYDPSATEAGSCEYPEIYYDCNGVCINDNDFDDICNEIDNCPLVYNPDQTDTNNDGIGDDCDGIDLNENNDFTWNIYPNPFTNYTVIKFENAYNNKVSVQIINLSGKIVYHIKQIESGHKIENTFAPGYYIIQLESEKSIIKETLIIQ